MKLEWIPASGEAPVVLSKHPYRVISMDGFGGTEASPMTERGPGQIGASLVDSSVGERVMSLGMHVYGADAEDILRNRHLLSRAFVVLPTEPGHDPERGILRVTRDGSLPIVEIEAVPRRSPQSALTSSVVSVCDIEVLGPDPFFRELTDRNVRLEGEGGFQFALEHPFEMVALNIEAELLNEGDIPVPIRVRLFGECTAPRLTNVTTGEAIEVTGAVAAGDYIEINTGFGLKAIELVAADGTRTNAMDRLNLSVADFFKLRRGSNVLRFSAASNVSGKAIVDWRQQYAGI